MTTKIFFIWKLWKRERIRLIKILKKYDGGKKMIYFLNKYNGKCDDFYFNKLGKIKKNKGFTKYRAIKRCEDLEFIKNELKMRITKDTKILDIGTFDGSIPYFLSKKFKIPKIFTVDIERKIKDEYAENLHFEKIKNNVIPFENKFDIVTAFMVFHHVKKLKDLLMSINKCMKKNGILIVREHNVKNETDKKLVDFQHMYINKIFGHQNTTRIYYNMYNLKKIINKEGGMIHVKLKKYPKINNNPTNYYYSVFKKII
jgi:2-polyprenyl-3-methyl-5-hydroxy-6-metoxy-1,4-benzoquinol methylase